MTNLYRQNRPIFQNVAKLYPIEFEKKKQQKEKLILLRMY